MRALRFAAAVGLLGLASTFTGPPAAHAAEVTAEHAPRSPIKHLVTLMQENHTFDNYFGTYPGADGIPPEACMIKPRDPKRAASRRSISASSRSPISRIPATSSRRSSVGRHGRLRPRPPAAGRRRRPGDGLLRRPRPALLLEYRRPVRAIRQVLLVVQQRQPGEPHVLGHGDVRELRRRGIPLEGFGNLPTIFDRLEEAGVSWKFYVQNYDPSITFRTARRPENSDRGVQTIWNPLLAYPRYVDDPKMRSRVVDLSEYYNDLEKGAAGRLLHRAVGLSEHPPGRVYAGERFVRNLINALASSGAWSESAFMWTC